MKPAISTIVVIFFFCCAIVTAYASSAIPAEPQFPYHSAVDDIAGSQNSIWFGGDNFPLEYYNKETFNPGVLINILAKPYGNYNNGCGLCLLVGNGSETNGIGRAAISGGDWHGGINANKGMGDIVGFYEYIDQMSARLILPVALYTPSEIILKSPLTNEQMKKLHPGMYVWTNSVDTRIHDVAANHNTLPTPRFYGGYIIAWNRKKITVNGWSVYGAENAIIGQVPSISKLDNSIYSARSIPMVWIGSPMKPFARNVYENFSQAEAGSEQSLAHEFALEEADFRYHTTIPHSIKYSGLILSPQANGGIIDGTAFTDDSVGIGIAGGLPIQILLDGNCNSRPIIGHSLYVGAACSGFNASTHLGDTYTLSENVVVANNNSIRYVTRIVKDRNNLNGIDLVTGPIVTPGTNPIINNIHDTWYGHLNGYVNAGIKYGLSDSSLSLCGSSTNCGIKINGDGTVKISTFLVSSASIEVKGGVIETAPTPPQTSHSPCRSGQHAWDIHYEYRCIKNNFWKRTPLESW
ncbi:hypothetical protein [Acetobacter senegalensis]|uniref:hypothetical protein n=1 Tax=Acetobacter senegalensis TaxID=446692 RepID=UPI002652A9E6|nr:hypothetical protein [Acetobacter senegalensis]MDN7354076.1 hypothetical protein [Acetobacter senegalensis]